MALTVRCEVEALLDHNIVFDPSLVYVCNNNSDFEDGYYFAQKLIQDHGKNVDAVFAITDVITIGVIKYFSENKIKIPEDVAVFGFSNWFMSSIVTPSLSTVEQPGYKMGKKAAKILMEEITTTNKNIAVRPQQIVLKTKLILRESC